MNRRNEMADETIDEKVARLEKELAEAKRELMANLLPVGTAVMVIGYVSDIDESNSKYPYQIRFTNGVKEQFEWFNSALIKAVE